MRLRASTGWAATVVLAASGCGTTIDTPDSGSGSGSTDEIIGPGITFARSGSRLVALGYSSNEARIFRAFHDQELGFECDFTATDVGDAQRCSPRAQVEVVYTDPTCLEPAAWLRASNTPPTPQQGDAVSGMAGGLTEHCPGDAPPHRTAYRIAERLQEEQVLGAPALPVYSRGDGGCQPASPPGRLTPPVHRLVPMDETMLARAERQSLNVGNGLRLTRLIADDGAELSQGVTDADGTPCELQRDGECVPEPIARPSGAYQGGYWWALNADCTEAAFTAPYPATCGVPQIGIEEDGTGPATVWALSKAAAAYEWQVVVPASGPTSFACKPSLGSPTDHLAGQRELTGTFPKASRLRRGTSALHVDWHSIGDTELLPLLADWRNASPGIVPSARFLNEAGKPCQILAAEDGTLRCADVDDAGQVIGPLTAYPQVFEGPI